MLREDELLELLDDLSRAELERWVAAGWVRPGRRGAGRVYREIDVARIRLICEMRRDLAVGEEAIDLVLPLLDQVYGLRRELRRLGRAIGAQPEAVRRAILDSLGREDD